MLWRAQGTLPRLLQLMYLGNGEIVRYQPDEADLRATERKVEAVWQAIERARLARDWRPRPGRLCDWCAHKPICPAFGGTPPDLPEPDAVLVPAQPGSRAGRTRSRPCWTWPERQRMPIRFSTSAASPRSSSWAEFFFGGRLERLARLRGLGRAARLAPAWLP